MYMTAFLYKRMKGRTAMKKFMFFIMLLTCAAVIGSAVRADMPTEELKLYVVDAEMLHLIPVDITVRKADKAGEARAVISALIRGFDENPKIRRLIPDIRGCMSVKVAGNTAYVNITESMIKNHPDGRDIEKLTVYSIVNSLTAIRGIDSVKFTINGRPGRKFMGYMDMRASFAFESFV